MRCEDVLEGLQEYWDWPENDDRRRNIDEHVTGCPSCAEELQLWKESALLIRMTSESEKWTAPIPEPSSVAASVMNRIYADDSWRIPVQNRLYHFSFRTRKLVTGVLSFFLALFVISLFGALTTGHSNASTAQMQAVSPSALKLTANLVVEDATSASASSFRSIPVASISEPLLLRMTPVQADPNYWLALSLIGIVCVLMIMSWLSRVRA